jgi:hypothetical protein
LKAPSISRTSSTWRCVAQSKKKRAMYEGFLKSIHLLKSLTPAEIRQLADSLRPANFEDGETLIHQAFDELLVRLVGVGRTMWRHEASAASECR